MKKRKNNRIKELFYSELRVAGCIPLFLNHQVNMKIIEGLKWSCEKRGLRIYDYTLLPDRVIFIADTAWGSLGEVLESFKKFSSKSVLQVLQAGRSSNEYNWMLPLLHEMGEADSMRKVQVWSSNQIMELLYKQEQHDKCAESIHNRPVELGWVVRPEHYRYGSANPVNPLNGWIVEAIDPWS